MFLPRETPAIQNDSRSAQAEYIRKYMAKRRAGERDIAPLPDVVDPKRRAACLADPRLFLKTYFPDRFYLPFAKHHEEMIDAILFCAANGGDQAIAAPRGEGKTEVTKAMTIYALCRSLVRFVVVVGASGVMAESLYSDIKNQFANNDLLMEDFPEVCYPVRRLEGAPQRASGQTLHGVKTRIEWKKKHVRFARIEGSPCAGAAISYAGLDAAIRGLNLEGLRPDLVLLDDPETYESAHSEYQTKVRMQKIDMDIAGLAGPSRTIARVALCTLQTTECVAAQLTDPKQRGSWNGKRYRMVDAWPDRRDLWDEYIAKRQEDLENGDRTTKTANSFYLKNRKAMDAGAKVSNPNRLPKSNGEDAGPVVHSALQHVFNLIADTSIEAFFAEYQNDPVPESRTETAGLTAEIVRSRSSGLLQGEVPPETDCVTVGIDVGKYYCHWAKVAWAMETPGRIVDYGVIEVPGRTVAEDTRTTEIAIQNALSEFRTELLSDGTVDFVLVDSGDYTNAVYDFVRNVGGNPFAAAKGWDETRFRPGKPSNSRLIFDNVFATYQPSELLWLYNVHADHWKQWVHDRFLTPTLDADNMPNVGSLSIFATPNDRKRHIAFSHHIVAEEQQTDFVPGRGLRRRWRKLSKNNHWLDATALACAAAGCLGVRIVAPEGVSIKQREKLIAQQQSGSQQRSRSASRFKTPDGRAFVVTER